MDDFELSKELREKYIVRRWEDLEHCRGAIEKGDYALLTRIGHNLKGNAASYGFDQLGQIGAELEVAGRAGDLPATQRLLVAFKDFLDQVKI